MHTNPPLYTEKEACYQKHVHRPLCSDLVGMFVFVCTFLLSLCVKRLELVRVCHLKASGYNGAERSCDRMPK